MTLGCSGEPEADNYPDDPEEQRINEQEYFDRELSGE